MAEPDLQAEVLAGLDKEIEQSRKHAIRDRNRAAVWTAHRTALRHLREIVERHERTYGQAEFMGDAMHYCKACRVRYPCPTLLSLAPDYAPRALKEIVK